MTFVIRQPCQEIFEKCEMIKKIVNFLFDGTLVFLEQNKIDDFIDNQFLSQTSFYSYQKKTFLTK